MNIEVVLSEKIAAIKARYREKTGREINDVSLWFYGDRWTIYMSTSAPRYESNSASYVAFNDIDSKAAEVVDELVEKVTRQPTAAEIAEKIGVSEAKLCEIVCAAKSTQPRTNSEGNHR